MTMEHRIANELLTKRVHVHLAGVGGNGAQMAACLARLDLAMRALGHPYGLFVTAIDDDVVTEEPLEIRARVHHLLDRLAVIIIQAARQL